MHNASSFSDRADTYKQSHPEYQHTDYQHNAGDFQQSHPDASENASQVQQNRFNEANTLQQNRCGTSIPMGLMQAS